MRRLLGVALFRIYASWILQAALSLVTNYF